MKHLIPLMALAFAGSTLAQGATCSTEATARKLSGTAKTAFLKTCEANAKAKLVLAPKERKYSVAPTSSFGHCEHSAADL